MNKFLTNIVCLAKNLHVSLPALVGTVLVYLPKFWPQYRDAFHLAAKALGTYSTIAAANSIPSLPTGPLKKSDETKVLDLVDNMKATPELTVPEVPKPSTNT